MATALLLWSSSKDKKQENPENTPPSSTDQKPESSKPRCKRSSKPNASSGFPKRPPQRGLGVAQLERLRLQERWRKIIESDPLQAHNLHFQFPFPVSDPQASSLSLGPFPPSNYGAFVADAQMRRQIGIGNGAFPVVRREFASGRGAFPNHPAADRFRSAAAETHEARLQMARELSSSQIPQCLSDQCEVCAKKKRIQGESPMNGWSSSSRIPDAEMDGCNFLGLNLAGGSAVDTGTKDFGGREERCGASSGMHVLEVKP